MAQYRAIHTKVVQSFDFNEMPDDFTRLTWVLLPLGVDCEGRGIYNGSWIKSKLYPMRDDVTGLMILEAMEYFISKGMVVRYSVGDREYFYIVNFKMYQRGLEKETKSVIPSPELVQSYSGVREELGKSNSALNANANANANSNANANANAEADAVDSSSLLDQFSRISGLPIPAIKAFQDKWLSDLVKLRDMGVTDTVMKRACKELTDRGGYKITQPASIIRACEVVLAERKRKDETYIPIGANSEYAGLVNR